MSLQKEFNNCRRVYTYIYLYDEAHSSCMYSVFINAGTIISELKIIAHLRSMFMYYTIQTIEFMFTLGCLHLLEILFTKLSKIDIPSLYVT